jgi:hypothetical protein
LHPHFAAFQRRVGLRTLFHRQAIDPEKPRPTFQLILIPRFRQSHVTLESFLRFRFQFRRGWLPSSRDVRCAQPQGHARQKKEDQVGVFGARGFHLSHNPFISNMEVRFKVFIRRQFPQALSLPTVYHAR